MNDSLACNCEHANVSQTSCQPDVETGQLVPADSCYGALKLAGEVCGVNEIGKKDCGEFNQSEDVFWNFTGDLSGGAWNRMMKRVRYLAGTKMQAAEIPLKQSGLAATIDFAKVVDSGGNHIIIQGVKAWVRLTALLPHVEPLAMEWSVSDDMSNLEAKFHDCLEVPIGVNVWGWAEGACTWGVCTPLGGWSTTIHTSACVKPSIVVNKPHLLHPRSLDVVFDELDLKINGSLPYGEVQVVDIHLDNCQLPGPCDALRASLAGVIHDASADAFEQIWAQAVNATPGVSKQYSGHPVLSTSWWFADSSCFLIMGCDGLTPLGLVAKLFYAALTLQLYWIACFIGFVIWCMLHGCIKIRGDGTVEARTLKEMLLQADSGKYA